LSPRSKAIKAPASNVIPAAPWQHAFFPFDVLLRWLAMLIDQIAKKRSEGVALLLFRQDAGNIARNRICSSGADFPVDSGKLMLRQANGDLRPGHTKIIRLVAPAQRAILATDSTPPNSRAHCRQIRPTMMAAELSKWSEARE
jgi:hypothetical protein